MKWIALLSVTLYGLASVGRADLLNAGVAVRDITPPVGFAMWGYGDRHDTPSVGVRDPLYAKAIVLTAGDAKLALVGLDLGRAPTRASMATIRAAVLSTAGVQTVMIVGSHTHHGPVIETEDWPTPERPYVRDLEQAIIDAIVAAAEAAEPVKMGLGSADVSLNRNRHWKGPDPPVDRELAVIRLDRLDGRPLAVLVNFAAHPTTLPAEQLEFSADYPGVMTRRIEAEVGAPAAFFQGAAGDLSTRREGRDTEAYGEALAQEALAIWKRIQTTPTDDARIQAREDDFRFTSRVDLASPIVRQLYNRAFYKELVDAYVTEYADGVRPHLTSVLIGWGDREIALVGVSGELFANHAIRLKRRSPVPTLVFGYANGYQQYFPTIEAVAQGGYGADPPVAPAEVGAGERMMNRALIRLFEMQGKM